MIFLFSFSEAAVIISRESGSRTIVYNPGNQEPLNASEFALAFERSHSSFHWIHFEARPFVHYMLSYLSNKDKEVSRPLRHSVIMLFFNFGCMSHSVTWRVTVLHKHATFYHPSRSTLKFVCSRISTKEVL